MAQTKRVTKQTIAKAVKQSERKPVQKWQLQTAKAQFSEVFRRARTEGPQWVSKQGKEEVVILPAEEFLRLTKLQKQPTNIVDFFRNSPLMGSGIDLERDEDYGREIEL